MARETVKRVGRPMKEPAHSKKRTAVTLRLSSATKKLLDASALANNRSQAAEAEMMIEQGFAVQAVLGAMKTDLTKIRQGRIEEAFREAGYIIIQHTLSGGKVWGLATDFPHLQSKFIE